MHTVALRASVIYQMVFSEIEEDRARVKFWWISERGARSEK